jgi:exonuclease III
VHILQKYVSLDFPSFVYTNTVDMLIIAETKIDNSFPDAQFKIDNYHFCRADRNAHGGGLIVYVRSDLACDRKNKLECKTIESIMIGSFMFREHVIVNVSQNQNIVI